MNCLHLCLLSFSILGFHFRSIVKSLKFSSYFLSWPIFHSIVSSPVSMSLHIFCRFYCCWYPAFFCGSRCYVSFLMSMRLALCPSTWSVLEKWGIFILLCLGGMFCNYLLGPFDFPYLFWLVWFEVYFLSRIKMVAPACFWDPFAWNILFLLSWGDVCPW